jgi:hypothetical protein
MRGIIIELPIDITDEMLEAGVAELKRVRHNRDKVDAIFRNMWGICVKQSRGWIEVKHPAQLHPEVVMFGKGKKTMSGNDKFVMAMGKKAGNLKGRGTAPKSAPTQGATSTQTPKKAPPGYQRGKKSLGRVGTM